MLCLECMSKTGPFFRFSSFRDTRAVQVLIICLTCFVLTPQNLLAGSLLCQGLFSKTAANLSVAEQNLSRNIRMITGVTVFEKSSMNHKDWIWRVLLRHGIAVRTEKASTELLRIITAAYSDSLELKNALNKWARDNHLGIEVVIFSEIEDLGRDYYERGLISSPGPYVSKATGNFDDQLYVRAANDGIHLISDAHDLYHLDQYTDPEFRKLFSDRYDFMGTLLEVGKDDRYAAVCNNIFEQIGSFIRMGGHENWTYIVPDLNGRPTIYTQGTAFYDSLIMLRSTRKTLGRDQFISGLLGDGGRTETDEIFYPEIRIRRLPGLNESLESSTNNRKIMKPPLKS